MISRNSFSSIRQNQSWDLEFSVISLQHCIACADWLQRFRGTQKEDECIQSSLLYLQKYWGGCKTKSILEKTLILEQGCRTLALDGTSLPSFIDKWQHTILQYTVKYCMLYSFLSGQLTATLLFKTWTRSFNIVQYLNIVHVLHMLLF
jgi:hypothetical protein